MINKFLRDLDILEGNVADLISESDTAEEAKRRGWSYHGYGYWEDSSGKVVGRTIDNKLVPISQSMASTFTDTTVGGASKTTEGPQSTTTEAPPPPKKKIPISKYGQPTSFYAKFKSDARDTIASYAASIKDITSLTDMGSILKGFSSLLAHSSIPIGPMPPDEVLAEPHVMGRWNTRQKTITIAPNLLDALEQKLERIQAEGISGLMRDYVWGSTGDGNAPIPNARMTADTRVTKYALGALATLFHEAVHANDVILNEAYQRDDVLAKKRQFGIISTKEEAEFLRVRKTLIAPEVMSFEFMTEHKARHTLRELSQMESSVYMKNVLASVGGYSNTLNSYYEIFAQADIDVDALVEDMWDSKDTTERNQKLESAVVSALKTSIDAKLKSDGIDVEKLGELDAEIYSDMKEAFDEISKITALRVLPNVGAQEVVNSFYEHLVHQTGLTQQSVFKTRAEKPDGFDTLDDMCKVIAGYAVNSNAILKQLWLDEPDRDKQLDIQSMGKPSNMWVYDPLEEKERKTRIHKYLRYKRNTQGL